MEYILSYLYFLSDSIHMVRWLH